MSCTDFSEGAGLPDGWVSVRLADVLSEPLSNGRSVRDHVGGFPVLRLTSIKDGWIDLSESKRGAWTADEAAPFYVTEGDFLLSRGNGSLNLVGRGGVVGAVPTPVAFPDTMIRVRPDRRVLDPAFLRLLWQSPIIRSQIESRVRTTAGIYKLNQKILEDIRLLLPPLSEQERIVEALDAQLSRLHAAVTTAQRARRRLEGLRKTVFLKLVPEEPPGDWRVVTVEEAGTVELGRARHPDWHNGPEMHPYLRVANVFEDRIDTSDIMEMDFSGIFEKYKLYNGDVLLNEGQSPHLVGRPALYRGVPESVAFTNSLLRFQANEDVLPEWALMVFRRHLHAKRFMREVRITTNIAHLSAKRLKAVEFPIPPLSVQKQLVTRCDELLTGIAAVDTEAERSLRRANALRKALLRKAFSGCLAPQKPDDESAAAVLDRIRTERAAHPKPKRTRKVSAARKAAETNPVPEPTEAPRTSVQQENSL
ncbi:restriction endonuclease subunit S [Streptomyces cellulosae]|uniref:Restriction endonuclease subunit S n=1 Tax=Streptomyces thermocarboxydus TaxID=59299 RepID=A0ABU3JBX4_9ACTN|nr:restriction endonuclease subunit S [Streptomyces sp. McG7]MDT6972037.1 restriction endonuclease subunit S [Streptomyces thermocarboxydus]MYQ32379.1 restriction endonuclease subunit S [Streptomyces sp. SID4956]THC56911.1 restriction endonuclease subunit S [Streptomyces sp. Akac8]WSB92822.1 restriction endonuclease subunit S [Streptomyces cellulosae]